MKYFRDISAITFVLSLLLAGSRGQNSQPNGSQATPRNVTAEALLDQEMQRLMSADSMEEVLAMGILHKDGHIATAQDLGATVDENGRLMVSNGGGHMGVPDVCSPRETSVDVRDPGLPSSSRLYPTCIKVPRCGGCCGVPDVVCTPLYVERQIYNLLEISYQGSGMTIMNQYPVEIERHLNCECQCSLSADKCGPLKNFVHNRCACECLTTIRCDPPKVFSHDTCGCVCAERYDCCTEFDPDCWFSFFNEDTCECDMDFSRTETSSNHNFTQADIQAYVNFMANRHRAVPNPSNNNQPQPETTPRTTTTTTTPPTTTTRTTTTTTSPQPRHPCATVRCPRNWLPFVNSRGACQCRPRRMSGR